jgi:hypothetical protein
VNVWNDQLTSYLKPVIAIDLRQDRAFAGFAHEMEHFRDWKKLYDKYRQAGLDHETATRKSVEEHLSPDNYVAGERKALDAEIKNEIQYAEHIFNQSREGRRAHFFYEFNYVNRMSYPEFEGVLQLLRFQRNGQTIDENLLKSYFEHLITFSLNTKSEAIAYLKFQENLTDKQIRDLYSWEDASVLEMLIYPYGIERLTGENLYNTFVTQLARHAKSMGWNNPVLIWQNRRKQTKVDLTTDDNPASENSDEASSSQQQQQ